MTQPSFSVPNAQGRVIAQHFDAFMQATGVEQGTMFGCTWDKDTGDMTLTLFNTITGDPLWEIPDAVADVARDWTPPDADL